MGLDNYAKRTDGLGFLTREDIAAFEAAGTRLCGGLMSGEPGSFRGKVYDALIAEVTGESLYQRWIPPETVEEMYQALRDFDPEGFEGYYDERFGDLETQLRDLREFFRVCSERELGIEASW